MADRRCRSADPIALVQYSACNSCGGTMRAHTHTHVIRHVSMQFVVGAQTNVKNAKRVERYAQDLLALRHTNTHTHTHTGADTCQCLQVYNDMQMHIHTYRCIYINASKYGGICNHTHTHTRAHTRAHIKSQKASVLFCTVWPAGRPVFLSTCMHACMYMHLYWQSYICTHTFSFACQ